MKVVSHGKTTLVDGLFARGGTFDLVVQEQERSMTIKATPLSMLFDMDADSAASSVKQDRNGKVLI